MGMKLLISDANIIIDIIAGELVESMFALDYEFATPDILYVEELDGQHPEIVQAGLRLIELQSVSVSYATKLYQNGPVPGVSINDCMALALSKQEECDLLTGDAMLKQMATMEGVTVHGTLWLVGEMLDKGCLSINDAENAYKKMLDDGSRLPLKEIKNQLDQ